MARRAAAGAGVGRWAAERVHSRRGTLAAAARRGWANERRRTCDMRWNSLSFSRFFATISSWREKDEPKEPPRGEPSTASLSCGWGLEDIRRWHRTLYALCAAHARLAIKKFARAMMKCEKKTFKLG